MIGLSFGEILLLGLLFLILFDSEKMPELMRAVGSFLAKARKVLFEAQQEVSQAVESATRHKDEFTKIANTSVAEIATITPPPAPVISLREEKTSVKKISRKVVKKVVKKLKKATPGKKKAKRA
ncbi:MAG: twin-arginine translocase TatA/TatE family subunit [Methylacidiphilales bacterium]|nr:twin-arginine translocase TatA/TatE family subunit [Candidatus Methylacidiphilales bacterium]